MNNICWIITSAIGLENKDPLRYSFLAPRTAFSPEERFRQTQYSVNSINFMYPGVKIFLLDISENYELYQKGFAYKSNVEYVPCQELAPDVAHLCRTDRSKGRCESNSTRVLLDSYRDQLKNYDFVIKLSGRYFYTYFDKSLLNIFNRDKFLFKTISNFNWQDSWSYPKEMNIDGKLWSSPTQTYAVGGDQFDYFCSQMQAITNYYKQHGESVDFVDYEVMMHYFVLRGKPVIDGIPWSCGGWGGSFGNYDEW